MQKQPNIRWRKSDEKELRRRVKNYNAKIRYIEKNKPELAHLQPERVSFKDLKSKITTRSDFKYELEKLTLYSKKGSEKEFSNQYGVKTTQFEKELFERNQARENRRRARRRKEIEGTEVTIAGVGTGQTRASMGTIKENAVKESKRDPNKMNVEDWKRLTSLFDKKQHTAYNEEQKLQMLKNYIKGMQRVGFSEELQEFMNTIDLDTFIKVVDTDEAGKFDFIYDKIELKRKEEKLWQLWEQHSTGKNLNNINILNVEDNPEFLKARAQAWGLKI